MRNRALVIILTPLVMTALTLAVVLPRGAENGQSPSQQTSKSTTLAAPSAVAAPYNGPDATTPYVAHLDAKTGKVLDASPEGPSVPLDQCVADQMAKQPEPAQHGVVTLHVCHPNSAPPMVVEQTEKSEPNREWNDHKPETVGGRRSITI